MAISTLSASIPKRNGFADAVKAWLASFVVSLNAMLAELYYREIVISVPVNLHASKLIHNLVTLRASYTVQSVDYVPDTAQGSALTATVVKATGTAAPAAGTTPLHAAGGINLNGAAHTVQSMTLTATAADLALVAGERIGIVLSGAMTTGSGNVSIRLRRTSGS